jgi:hypothetical protein
MERRQDKYSGENGTPRMSRVQKNQSLYNEINSKIGYEEIIPYENGAEIDLSILNTDKTRREDYQRIKEYKNLIEEDDKPNEDINYRREVKPKTFDINEALEEAKRNRKIEDDLEKKRNLKDSESVLSNLNRKYLHNKDFSEQDSDDLKELIDTITSKTLVDDIKDEEEKELLSELLATTIDIKLEQELSEKEINKLYDEKNIANNNMNKMSDDDEDDTLTGEQLENSFFTHSVELTKEDLEDDDDEDEENKSKDNKETSEDDEDDEEGTGLVKIIVVVAILLALILLITYFVLHQFGFSLG